MRSQCRRSLLAMMMGLVGAGLARGQEVPADTAAAMAQAMAALGQAAEKSAAAGAVDAKELRALLPEKDAVAGFKALEEYDGEDKSSKVQIYTGDRVAVEVEAFGMSFDAVKQIVGKLDLKKLAALKPTAAPAPSPATTK